MIGADRLVQLTVLELLRGYVEREFSPVEVVDAYSERIAMLDTSVCAFVTVTSEGARLEAKRAERAYLRLGQARRLEGIPIAVKDIFDTAGIRTTYGSSIFAEHVPERDALAVRRSLDAGAIVIGKTLTHEFAWGITSVSSHYRSCRNPWALGRVAGGSSGGSAAAVAAREAPIALGSDTGGSIRIPAAFCGVVGLKPTFGRVGTAGMLPLARSLDHPGVLAKTPSDAGLLLAVLARDAPLGQLADDLSRQQEPGDLGGLRIGVCRDLHMVPLAPDVDRIFGETLTTLGRAGAAVEELELEHASEALNAFRVTQLCEAHHAHVSAGLYPARATEYESDIRDRLDQASTLSLDHYLDAQLARDRVSVRFQQLFEAVDLLVTPVAPCPPPEIGDQAPLHLGEHVDLRGLVMPYTIPQNLLGLPACAVRAGIDSAGLPVAVQLTGPAGTDTLIMRVAHTFHQHTAAIQKRWPLANPPARHAAQIGSAGNDVGPIDIRPSL